ncbi:hypothetical protein [Algoriphagus sp. CAU 1675]|uniref:hypothetical protein n=1 Tax=Algoriphagus sp. CAU 1675 TaxID=3032597 RepID=UPI0023D9B3BE|nr:hypothetical protein [Algoriphagus sp. CAU 1675]MDF2158216.1 hypothetical protein [Algoriphagus sp. CAU 1675]
MAEKEKVTSLNPFNQWRTVILLSLTLGLAPFVPEPHIWGKIKWVAGGAVGMKLIDWGDLIFHGFPWLMFLRLAFLEVKKKLSAA